MKDELTIKKEDTFLTIFKTINAVCFKMDSRYFMHRFILNRNESILIIKHLIRLLDISASELAKPDEFYKGS